jgi:hypothetical protein
VENTEEISCRKRINIFCNYRKRKSTTRSSGLRRAMSFSPLFFPSPRHSLPLTPVSSSQYSLTTLPPFRIFDIKDARALSDFSLKILSFKLFANLEFLSTLHTSFIIMHDSIQHPQLRRLNETKYVLNNLNSQHPKKLLHVGQISEYVAFDKTLREGCSPASLPGIPMGYLKFASVFNAGTPRVHGSPESPRLLPCSLVNSHMKLTCGVTTQPSVIGF